MASGSTAVLGHTIGRIVTVAPLPMVGVAVLRLLAADDQACNVTVMVGQGLYSLHRVAKSRVMKILMLWAEGAVES